MVVAEKKVMLIWDMGIMLLVLLLVAGIAMDAAESVADGDRD